MMEIEDGDRSGDDILDSWEEAQDNTSKLEKKIEQQMKIKQKDRCESLLDDISDLPKSYHGPTEDNLPPIRILKRPQTVSVHSNSHPSQRSSALRDSRNGSMSAKTLEERVAAYAEARERIFGTADPFIHNDLPVQ
ncbi:unnamed protein product [Soboliphyme baturini]|uniref:SUZ domain-containing protein n=1 Tax=Soboliphyme baturini TaxID=241478 RepID=A0A183IVQ1_9BILA|nr:unnamed protein product [Soboliphyme baturini]